MKYWLLALAGLLGLTAGLARADYLILIVNVGQQQSALTTGPGPGPGAAGMGGAPGFAGRNIGAQGMAGMGGFGGVPGFRGGAMGIMGGPLPAPMGAMGAAGFMGMQGGPTPISAQMIPAWVEVENFPNPRSEVMFKGGQSTPVKHKWGTVYLVPTNGPISLAGFYHQPDGKPFPRVSKRFEIEHAKLLKEKTTEKYLEVAEWALSHGLLPRFEDTMERLALEEKTHPAVVAYQKIKADLKNPVARTPSSRWYDKLKASYNNKEDLKTAAHYVLLHSQPENDPEVLARGVRLEEHLRSYYYWFALRGLALPMPKERLVVVVAFSEDEFKHRLHKDLYGGPIVSDGFQTLRENLVVLSARPRSEAYDALEKFSSQYWVQPKTGKAAMLKGKNKPSSYDEVHAGALALVSREMEEASELTSIGQNGSRQLLYASGLLPPHVAVPEWVLYGLSSVFETPMGSPWQTLGAPSPVHLPYLKEHMKRGLQLEKNGADVIRQIVTDTYFRQSQTVAKNPAAVTRAQATAWGFSYYLARKELPKLQAYFKELARMPRDLDLDEEVLLGCFARAFDAWDNNKKTVINPKLENIYRHWEADMNAASIEGLDMFLLVQRLLQDAEKAMNTLPNPVGAPGQPPG